MKAAANLVMTKQITLDDNATGSATVSSPIRLIVYKAKSGDMTGFWAIGSYYGYGSSSSSFDSTTATTVEIWILRCALSNNNKTINISSTNGTIGSGYKFYIFI